MRLRSFALTILLCASCAWAVPPSACRRAVITGELNAGKGLTQPLGGGLKLWFQPIASGWILRIIPATGPIGQHDYAELATPPYQSVTPLSISTDFSFRAQDAVGWNPRRFRFATTAQDFAQLERVYRDFIAGGATPSEHAQSALAHEIGKTSEGTFTIVDSRLVPGTADQWRAAAAVASHFETTAHTLAEEPDHTTSPLGRLVWLRFRLEIDLPAGFPADQALHLEPRVCANP